MTDTQRHVLLAFELAYLDAMREEAAGNFTSVEVENAWKQLQAYMQKIGN